MPTGRPRRQAKSTSLAAFVNKETSSGGSLNELSTDVINLFNLLTLIIDIEYRHRYGDTLDWQQGRGYQKQADNDVLADQLPPVDTNGSARIQSTGGNCK